MFEVAIQKSSGVRQATRSPFLCERPDTNLDDVLSLVDDLVPKKMAFVRAVGRDVIETARDALELGLAFPVLIGEESVIKRDADELGWNLEGVRIENAQGEQAAIESATSLVAKKEVSGLVKGQIHSDTFMSGIVRKQAGIRSKKRMVHIFVMLPPGGGKPLLVSDAAVNVEPNIETRVESALQMADLARKMGTVRPKVAILSATESMLLAVPSSIEANEIAALAASRDENADFAGPLSFDLALSPESVAVKGIAKDSPLARVAGQADALVVPDIVSGNVLFKSLVYCAGGLAAGLVIGGLVPILLTSRADPPAARLASLALAAIAGRKG